MLLVRCSRVDDALVQFARHLQKSSGEEVLLAIDESRAPVDARGLRKISVTPSALEELGIYVPPDAAWRCGDYILYLALRQGLTPEPIWLTEYDVRFSDAQNFFSEIRARAANVDFLASNLRVATPDWYWWSFAQARGQQPWRCFFPLTRYTSTAIELLYANRRRHSRDLARRWVWPNDEAFAATTLMNSALACADFNEFVADAWNRESFAYAPPIKGEAFTPPATPHLWHPVLYGADFEAKLTRAKDDSGNALPRRLTRRLLRPYLQRASWF